MGRKIGSASRRCMRAAGWMRPNVLAAFTRWALVDARQQRRDRIAQRRRERGRPLASAKHDLGADAFEKLGALERELAHRYYGIGGERRWTRRELAREFGLSTGRVEDLVNAAVRTLTVWRSLRGSTERALSVVGRSRSGAGSHGVARAALDVKVNSSARRGVLAAERGVLTDWCFQTG